LGTLVASGMIVGESLFGVVNAGLIVAMGKDNPLAVVKPDVAPANAFGVVGFAGCAFVLYRWMCRRGGIGN
jgi:hypothetical protein